jgi:hypothetical protein
MRKFKFLLICLIFHGAANNIAFADSNIGLPDSSLTPGAINTAVIQSNIASTICVPGFTIKIRPSSSYTTALKKKQLAAGYLGYTNKSPASYEEDHLISLELGGSPSSEANLWPEPWDGNWGARKKDTLENKLHDLVCSNQLSLSEAQSVIATNWVSAYSKYVLGESSAATLIQTQQSSSSTTKTTSPQIVVFKNCTEMNKVYPGGVAKVGAVNQGTATKNEPKYDSALYEANKKSDRDGDGIACEK